MRRGQTLIEVMLAAMLVTLLIFAIVSLYPGSMGVLRRSHDLSVGSNLSLEYIESARLQPFDQLGSVGFINTEDRSFKTNVILDATAPLGDPNLAHITATTTWNGSANTSLDYIQYNYLNPP